MDNIYEPPKSNLLEVDNTSGQGKDAVIPEGVKGWSWGAFLLNWIWAIGNRTYIGLLAFIPYLGFIISIILGFKGREWAWRNKKWESLEHFNQVQKSWSKWGLIVVIISFVIGILAVLILPGLVESSL